MNTDDFEGRLRDQPLRPVPEEWRQEILRAAQMSRRSAAANHNADLGAGWAGFVPTLRGFICGLLWPSPKAWAGLAVTWLLLLTVNYAIGTNPPRSTIAMRGHTPEAILVRREEQQLLAELLGPAPPVATSTADRPKPSAAQPRSEIKSYLLSA